MAHITKISQSDDPALDWRTINALIDAVNAINSAIILPNGGGTIRSDGQKLIFDLSGFLLLSTYYKDTSAGSNPPP